MKNDFIGSPSPASEAADAALRRTWIAVAAAILGVFMSILDIQITNASLKEIFGSLSATQDEGSWMSTAYLAAEVTVIPLTTFFMTVFGLRNYMLDTGSMKTALALGFINIYSGTVPATADAALTGTLLTTISVN